MIFVTVGTPKYDFSRLVKAVDELQTKEKIVVQLGYTKYVPKNCEWFRFTTPEKIEQLVKQCRVHISHGGIGSIMMPLEYVKPVVAVPRMKKFDEHVNDHQMQIVKEMEKQKKVIAVYDIGKLQAALEKAGKMKVVHKKKGTRIISIIGKFLEGEKKCQCCC